MADGFTLELDADLAARLKARAEEVGVSPTELALQLIDEHLFARDFEWEEGIDPDPAIDERIVEEAIRNGDTIPLEDALSQFRADLDRELAKRA